MQSLQARIDSFQKTRRVKRYPTKQSSSSTSIKWPHPPDFKANANTLAEAGFFFSPSWEDRDSVACFLCNKELSDWDADDDPFEIHYSKCRSSCAWAIVRCGLIDDMDDQEHFVFENKSRVPSCKAMEKARLETFGRDWWPHDGDSGHGATSAKMAQAGFVYTPQVAGDDTVTCLYCNLSLGGWEKDDDPAQEHRRRSGKSGAKPLCPFIASSSKPTRSKNAQPNLPPKKPPPVDKAEQQSEDELAIVEITDPPPQPPRARRGRARSTTTATSSRARRKTRATRGKSAKPPAPMVQRSPSPSQTLSRDQEEEAVLDTSMDVGVPSADAPKPIPILEPRRPSNELHQNGSIVHANGSVHSLPNGVVSPPGPSMPNKSDPPSDISLDHPDPVLSLSPTGQPTITNTQSLTPQERTLSLEQWIRQEINISYEKLRTDGQRQIELFRTRAAEIRKCIGDL